MNLTVIRENEVTNYEVNKLKTIVLELSKILTEKLEEGEDNKIIKEFIDKTKNEIKEKKRNLLENRSFFITKRKNTSIGKEENNEYSKHFFDHKMKTNLPKSSAINLNAKLHSSKTLQADFKDDGFIIGKGNIFDLHLNLMNKKEKTPSLYLRQNNTKKKTGKSENTSIVLDLNSSVSINNENNNFQENINVLKPSLKQSNILNNDTKNKEKSNEKIDKINSKIEIIYDDENNKIEKNNISQKKIKFDDENNKIEKNNISQNQVKFDDENNKKEKNNISQKQIKFDNENNKIEKNNNISQNKIKFDDENNNKEKTNDVSQKQIKFKEELEKNINKNTNLNNRNKYNSEDNFRYNINNKNIEENNVIKNKKNFSTLVINEYQNLNTNQKTQKSNQNRIKNVLKKNENKSEQIKNIRKNSPIFRPASTNPNSLRSKLNNPFNYKTNNITEHNDKTIVVPDNKIIDMPLIPFNKSNLEIEKNKSYLEKRLIELEFFTKKKFDELVNEIKIFIPIHFNSYIKDYSLINSTLSKKKNKTKQITLDTDLLFHNKY